MKKITLPNQTFIEILSDNKILHKFSKEKNTLEPFFLFKMSLTGGILEIFI